MFLVRFYNAHLALTVDAVEILHEEDGYHRDLKLENILVGELPDGDRKHLKIKICDFGTSGRDRNTRIGRGTASNMVR